MTYEEGYMYVVRTLTPPQKLEREHCVTFLYRDGGTLYFNARPEFGTQAFEERYIVSAKPLRPAYGRESSAHYLNRVVR